MKRRAARLGFGAALISGGLAWAAVPASAQTFQNYHCADGTRFIVAFYDYDTRAHLQIDGQPVALAKRLSWSGARYSGEGVTLLISKAGVVAVRHAKRPLTVCELDVRPD